MSDDQSSEGQTENDGQVEAAPPAEDWRSKFEGQQRVNRDLEKRSKSDLKALESLRARIAELEGTSTPKSEAESLAEKARKDGAAEALAVANRRVVRAEIKAAAAGRFADPEDAVLLLNLDDFKVGEDGEINGDSVREALDDLLERKPHLAAGGGTRWSGGADGGNRGTAVSNVLPGIPRLTQAYAASNKSKPTRT